MYLQRLDIQGFKSFAHKTTFLFPDGDGAPTRGITAVVGPNGSGKSNVADAIRWVLGEQSMRLLRSKKSEDVIFFGSDTKAQLGFCEVSLHFNNHDRAFGVDYAEVVITRRLDRSGESEYLINGAHARLADVVLLLAQGNCGQRSYSVIGQGMIDSLVTMSPNERKHFFDEAAGVRQYQIKKDQADSKIKSAQENVSSAKMIVSELEPKVRILERQMKRLEERTDLEQRYRALLKEVHGVSWYGLVHRMEELDERSCTQQLAVRARERDVAKLESQLDAARPEHASEERIASLREQNDQLTRQRTQLQNQLSLVDARLQSHHEKQGDVNLSLLQGRKHELMADLEHCAQEQNEARQRHAALFENERDCSERLLACEERIAAIESELCAFSMARTSLGIKDISVRLETVIQAREVFFADGATVEDLRKSAHDLFEAIQHLIDEMNQSKHNPDGTVSAQAANLETHYREKKDLLSELSQTRIALGIADHDLKAAMARERGFHDDLERVEKEFAYHMSANAQEKTTQLTGERARLEEDMKKITASLSNCTQEIDECYRLARTASTRLMEFQKKMNEAQSALSHERELATAVALERAKLEAHRDELFEKICSDFSLTLEERESAQASGNDLSSLGLLRVGSSSRDYDERRSELERVRKRLDHIGMIDPESLVEYHATKERYAFLTSQIADLTESIETLTKGSRELEQMMKERFSHTVATIEKKFQDYFNRLFNGGKAHLIPLLRDDEQELDESEADGRKQESPGGQVVSGIDISVMPPGKKLRNMNVLSGGEKAMTAIALICAIVSTIKPPFVVLDEVDAALDESNAGRFASILAELGTQTQFVVITHNRLTIHTAQMLYGVTMGDDSVSRVLSLDIAAADGMVKQS